MTVFFLDLHCRVRLLQRFPSSSSSDNSSAVDDSLATTRPKLRLHDRGNKGRKIWKNWVRQPTMAATKSNLGWLQRALPRLIRFGLGKIKLGRSWGKAVTLAASTVGSGE
ncbi:hypothetical protein SLEP1_g36838 [Rubroshorea leprosula]|uniref:Uncharacterized protein n=1 Tax=Rubroshorea leprosula TaxID=152421 RepID=A0AAV5KT96_9ROSI|nr:hypothetical protein SLEP1_g36838 [Rubroshorea leprosula]